MFNEEKFEINEEQLLNYQLNKVVMMIKKELDAQAVQNEDGDIVFEFNNNKTYVVTFDFLIHLIKSHDDLDAVVKVISNTANSVFEQNKRLINFEEVKKDIILVPQRIDSEFKNVVKCESTGIPLEELGLTALFAVDTKSLISYITEELLLSWGITVKELYELAIKNLIMKLPFKENSKLNVRTGTLDKYMVPDVDGYDISIKSSGIFILETLGLLKDEGTLVLIPSRDAFAVFKLDKHHIKIMGKYNNYVYRESTRYRLLEYLLYYKDGKWGFVKNGGIDYKNKTL